MAALLVAIGVMGVMLSVALPVWTHAAKRAREAELVFRGEQYARAVELYQRQFVGAYPPDFETLVEQRYLRRLYKDPMTNDGGFRPVFRSQIDDVGPNVEGADRPGDITDDTPEPHRPITQFAFDREGEGGVVGVVSRSQEDSLRLYNGRRKYSEWVFAQVTDRTAVSPAEDPAAQPDTPEDARGRAGVGTERTP